MSTGTMWLEVVAADAAGSGPVDVAVIGWEEAASPAGTVPAPELAATLARIPPAVGALVLVAAWQGDHSPLLAHAAAGAVAVTRVPSTDALKTVDAGAVITTLDRDRVVVVRPPVVLPRTLIATALAATEPHTDDPVHLADLLIGVDPAQIVFMEATRRSSPW